MIRLIRESWAAALPLIAVCLFSSNVAGNADLTLSDLQAGIENRSERLNGVSATIQTRVFNRMSDGSTETIRASPRRWEIKRQDGKIRSLQVDAAGFTYEFAWDGTKLTTLLTKPNRSEPGRYSGLIARDRQRGPFGQLNFLTVLEQRVFDADQPLPALMRRGQWQLIGREAVGNGASYHIRGYRFDGRQTTLDVWIDPTRDFAPVQIVVSKETQNMRFSQTMNNVHLVSIDGLNVVTGANIEIRNPFVLHDTIQLVEYTITDYIVGQQFPPDYFTIAFPHLTGVWDDVAKRSYVVDKGEFVRGQGGLTELVPDNSQRAVDSAKENPPGAAASSNREHRRGVRWWTWCILSMTVASIALALWRVARNRTWRSA